MARRYRILLSKRVVTDLERVFDHIAKDSPDAAAKTVERILRSIEGLKLFPHRTAVAGQSARLKHPVRSLPVPPYVVFFRVIDAQGVVRVVQVRHGAQRRPSALTDRTTYRASRSLRLPGAGISLESGGGARIGVRYILATASEQQQAVPNEPTRL